MPKTLKQVMPQEFSGPEYVDTKAQQHADVRVLREFDGTKHGNRWPGPHKNVIRWFALANGYAVGWNENPARGWSFPVIRWSMPEDNLSSESGPGVIDLGANNAAAANEDTNGSDT